MNIEKIKKIILEIIQEQTYENCEILLTSNLEKDLKFDELDMIETVMEIEDEFEINIPDDDYEKKWKTVNDVYIYLCKKIMKEKEYMIKCLSPQIIPLFPTTNRFKLMDLE